MLRIVASTVLAGAVIGSMVDTSSWAQSSPAQAVQERQRIMKSLWGEYYRDMSRVARGELTDASIVPPKATQASEALKKFAAQFPVGSGRDVVPETRSKPEIWTQKADFDAAITLLVNETNALGETAKGGNVEAIRAQFSKVAQACGGCHEGPAKSGGKFRFEQP